jgi:uncharacterized integral membrane protein
MGPYVKGIALIIILLLFITFGVKNSQSVHIGYYGNNLDADLPVYGLVYLCMLIGVLVGMIIGYVQRLNLRRTVKALEHESRELKEKTIQKEEKEVEV